MLTKTTFAALGVLLAAATASAQDRIRLKVGEPVEGTVVSMNFKEVSYEAQPGAALQIAAKDIMEIELDSGSKPYDYASAEDLFRRGDFGAAVKKFEAALRDPKASDPVKQFARFYIVQCSAEQQKHEEAIAAAKKMREAAPDTYFLKDSYVLQFQAARASGKPALLDEALKEFEQAASQKSVEDWKKQVELLKADLAESKGDFKTARSVFERFASDRDPQLALDARLGVLRCLGAAQDWPGLSGRAETYINDVKAKGGSQKLLLGAYLGKGKALLLGEKKNKEALIELLRCAWDIGPKVEACREHEEALAYAARACARYAGDLKDQKEKKDQYRDRAYHLKTELKRRYGDSALMKDVDAEINAIPK